MPVDRHVIELANRHCNAHFRPLGVRIFGRIRYVKSCDVCGVEFLPVVTWQKRCSKKCNSIASNTRSRMDPSKKICRSCSTVLPIEQFHPAHRSCVACEDLLAAGTKRCGGCAEVKPLTLFHKRAQRVDGFSHICKSCKSSEAKKRNADPLRKERNRDVKYRLKYGITTADVSAMARQQGGKCAICDKPETPQRRLVVDHNHKTGAVRSLLCGTCNSLLGYGSEDPKIFLAAIQYVERHNNDSNLGS